MANQPIQTATDQEYGQVRQQEDAQRAMPLPQMRPGERGSLLRGSENPNESVMQSPRPNTTPPAQRTGDSSFNQRLAVMMPYLLEEASKPTASPQTRFIVNQLALLATPPENR